MTAPRAPYRPVTPHPEDAAMTATDRTAHPTDTTTPAATDRSRSGRSGLSRYLALARAELTILLRNRVATFYAVAFAPMLVLMFSATPQVEMIAQAMGGSLTVFLVVGVVLFGLSVAVYYNLTTAVVARREKLVLKRLISGESTRGQVLAAIATPNVVIMLVQVAAVFVVGVALFGVPPLTNPVLAVLALVLAVPAFVMISFLTGTRTRTVEAAQLTTMPFMMAGMLLSGAIVPVGILPDVVVRVMEFTPIFPVTQLLQLGLAGTEVDGTSLAFADTFGAALLPVAVMLVWNVVLAWLLRREMQWEPRR